MEIIQANKDANKDEISRCFLDHLSLLPPSL